VNFCLFFYVVYKLVIDILKLCEFSKLYSNQSKMRFMSHESNLDTIHNKLIHASFADQAQMF